MVEKIKIYNVNVSKSAKKDLREIVKFIARNNPMNSLDVLKRIEKK